MTCHNCQVECKKFGSNRAGHQRFRCRQCSRTFTESGPHPLGDIRLPLDRALLCLQLIVEGNSVRSTERITGVHRDTILGLLEVAGLRAERLLSERIRRDTTQRRSMLRLYKTVAFSSAKNQAVPKLRNGPW